jgi:acetyl esterase/lipase
MRFDQAFANMAYIPGGEEYPARWARAAAAFRAERAARARLGLRYGSGARQLFDLFLPDAEPEGLVLFFHGGYWMAFGPGDFSHLARGAIERGWACAMPSYTLAPEAGLPAMAAEVRQALAAASREVAGPVVAAGHSAGGHLTARLACADMAGAEAIGRVRRFVPISPLSDLRPLMETAMNATLAIDAAVAAAESPALLSRRPDADVHVWVGGDERPRFLDQARRLGNAWSCPVTVEPGRHHFDVVEGLEQADSPLITALLG